MWTMALYDRGTPIITFQSVYSSPADHLPFLLLCPEKVESYGAEASYATFHFMSWNETGGFYKATDEEYLLEIID